MPKISYAEVRQQVNIEEVLAFIGYVCLTSIGRKWVGQCPLRCCDSLRCCSFKLPRSLWYCHKCHRGGNQLDLYAQVRGLSLYPAAVALCERAGIAVPYLTNATSGRSERRSP